METINFLLCFLPVAGLKDMLCKCLGKYFFDKKTYLVLKRIDYHILSPSLKGTVQATEIYKDERFSDHAPLIIDYDYVLPSS